jgi:hypothetical protein
VPARLEHLRAAHIASRGAASAASWEPVFEASLAAAGDSLRALSPGDLARVLGAFRGGAQDQERLFGFIHNHGAGPDGEALGIARALSEAASGPSQGGDAVAAGAPPPSLPPPSLPGTVPAQGGAGGSCTTRCEAGGGAVSAVRPVLVCGVGL